MLELLTKWFRLDDKVFSNFTRSKVSFEIRSEENYMYVIKGLKKNAVATYIPCIAICVLKQISQYKIYTILNILIYTVMYIVNLCK